MFANFLIGLREGLEASLVVGILVAYLVRTRNTAALPRLWTGVAAAIAISLSFGAVLTYGTSTLTFEAQEAIGGVLSIVAVCFVTWMVFWMKRAARGLKADLHDKLDTALLTGGYAVALTAFIAVAREGLETALFMWSAVQATASGWTPLVGAALGILIAVGLGYLIYRGALRVNLAVFFRWTGIGLIVVAAGVLAYGIHDLQESGLLPGLNNLAFDVSEVPLLAGGLVAALLKGIFNFSPQTTVLQAVTWVGYLVPTMYFYLRPARSATSQATQPTEAEATPPAQVGSNAR